MTVFVDEVTDRYMAIPKHESKRELTLTCVMIVGLFRRYSPDWLALDRAD